MKRALGRAWERWKAFSIVIGNAVARVILSIFYFVIMLPFALIAKLRTDALGVKRSGQGYIAREQEPADLEHARLQF